MIGKGFMVSGIIIEVIANDGDRLQTRNITTRKTVFFDRSALEKAIKLGMAEEITKQDDQGQNKSV